MCAACFAATRSRCRALHGAVPMGPECIQHRAALSCASGARLAGDAVDSADGRWTQQRKRPAPAVRADRRPQPRGAHARAALREPRVRLGARSPRVRHSGRAPDPAACALYLCLRRSPARLPRDAARRVPADALRAARATSQSRPPVPLALPGAVHVGEAVSLPSGESRLHSSTQCEHCI